MVWVALFLIFALGLIGVGYESSKIEEEQDARWKEIERELIQRKERENKKAGYL